MCNADPFVVSTSVTFFSMYFQIRFSSWKKCLIRPGSLYIIKVTLISQMISSMRINYVKQKKIGIVFAGLKYHLVVTIFSQNFFLVQNIILSFLTFFLYLDKSLFIFNSIVMNKTEFLFLIEIIEHFFCWSGVCSTTKVRSVTKPFLSFFIQCMEFSRVMWC